MVSDPPFGGGPGKVTRAMRLGQGPYRKLRVSAPGDPAEREADALAGSFIEALSGNHRVSRHKGITPSAHCTATSHATPVLGWVRSAAEMSLYFDDQSPCGALMIHHTLFMDGNLSGEPNTEMHRPNQPLLGDALAAIESRLGPITEVEGTTQRQPDRVRIARFVSARRLADVFAEPGAAPVP